MALSVLRWMYLDLDRSARSRKGAVHIPTQQWTGTVSPGFLFHEAAWVFHCLTPTLYLFLPAILDLITPATSPTTLLLAEGDTLHHRPMQPGNHLVTLRVSGPIWARFPSPGAQLKDTSGTGSILGSSMPVLRVRGGEDQGGQEDDGEEEKKRKVIAQAIKSSLAAALGCCLLVVSFAPK